MKISLPMIAVILSSVLLGCTLSLNDSGSDTEDTSQQEQEVKNTLIDMWDAIEKGDIERYAKYIHPDFTQFGETDSVLLVGKDAEISGMKQFSQQSEDVHTEMIEPRVTVRGNTAWIVYYWSDSGLRNGGLYTSRGKSTRIFVKEDGKWMCIHGHYTLLPVEIP